MRSYPEIKLCSQSFSLIHQENYEYLIVDWIFCYTSNPVFLDFISVVTHWPTTFNQLDLSWQLITNSRLIFSDFFSTHWNCTKSLACEMNGPFSWYSSNSLHSADLHHRILRFVLREQWWDLRTIKLPTMVGRRVAVKEAKIFGPKSSATLYVPSATAILTHSSLMLLQSVRKCWAREQCWRHVEVSNKKIGETRNEHYCWDWTLTRKLSTSIGAE